MSFASVFRKLKKRSTRFAAAKSMRWWSRDPSGEKVFTLEGAEHPYRVLVESMNEGAISLSKEGTVLYCNSAFARMVGISLDQIMGHDVCEFVPIEDRDALKNLIKQGLREPMRAEMTLLPSSGDLPSNSILAQSC